MKGFGIIASGESIRNLPSIASNFKDCFVFNNCSLELDHFEVILDKKNIGHVINKMPAEVLPYNSYKKFNIRDIYLVTTKENENLYKSSINVIQRYNLGLQYHWLPEDVKNFFSPYPNVNLSHYATKMACNLKPSDIYLVGLDFYSGDYMFQKTTQYLKEKAKRINMVQTFCDIVISHPNIKFHMITRSTEIQPMENLEIQYV